MLQAENWGDMKRKRRSLHVFLTGQLYSSLSENSPQPAGLRSSVLSSWKIFFTLPADLITLFPEHSLILCYLPSLYVPPLS